MTRAVPGVVRLSALTMVSFLLFHSSAHSQFSGGAGGGYAASQSSQGPLPVQIASFTAHQTGIHTVQLAWMTISEVHNYGFAIQRRSGQETSFSDLPGAFVSGQGTTNIPHQYAYSDESAFGEIWYYRLKQLDLDGTEHFTEPVRLDILAGVQEQAPRTFALLQNYPNPFNPATEITFSVATTGRATLNVYNTLGQRVATLFDEIAEAGYYYKVRFDGTRLASGVYFYHLECDRKSELKKLTLLK